MQKHKAGVVDAVKMAKYSFAGHAARMDDANLVKQILVSRSLADWRDQQARSTGAHARKAGAGPHPKRFNALRRWEAPFEEHFGVATSLAGSWIQKAQDRDGWKHRRAAYLAS